MDLLSVVCCWQACKHVLGGFWWFAKRTALVDHYKLNSHVISGTVPIAAVALANFGTMSSFVLNFDDLLFSFLTGTWLYRVSLLRTIKLARFGQKWILWEGVENNTAIYLVRFHFINRHRVRFTWNEMGIFFCHEQVRILIVGFEK